MTMNKHLGILIILLLTVSGIIMADNENVSLGDKTKAAFIYNFTRYIEWTDDSLQTFIIAVLGDSDILIPLKEIEKKKQVGNRRIKIEHCTKIMEIDTCHILFISESECCNLRKIIDTIAGRKILTISDTKGFARKGVAINFVIVNGKIRFEINSRALDATGLRVSSHLLKLALFVEAKD